MEYEMLKDAAEAITMSEEVKQRIIRNCKAKVLEESAMYYSKARNIYRKPAVVFAALAIVLSLSATGLATSGVLQGFFRDITDYRGAVVGTSYEQATDEIDLSVTVNGENLVVLVTFTNPGKLPYSQAENLSIGAYQIVDVNGKVIKNGENTAASPIFNGQAAMDIPVNDLEGGNYKLIINSIVTQKKADQPLNISGVWEWSFAK